ncbi:MAG: hypothetical protein K6T59_10145 [Bryobacteraceae bacterium]|nr:hypothetical protein [Bryobacteraceae bacterium]
MRRAIGRSGGLAVLLALTIWLGMGRGGAQAGRLDEARTTQASPQAAEAQPGAEEASYWMKRKLELSQRVLEGLALGDFERIGTAARTLDKLNAIENFVRGRNEAYRTQLEIFRAANLALIRHADRQNLEGATLAFHQMTLSCVNCHKQLRESNSAAVR